MVKARNWNTWAQPILVPAVVFLVVALLLTIVSRQLIALQESVRHTQEVKDQLSSIQSRLQDGESGMRGYVLSRNESLLQPYFLLRDSAEASLNTLEKLIADNPVQVQSMAALRPLLMERIETLTRGRNLYKPGAMLPLPIGQGPELQNKIREAIVRMMTEEDRLLGERRTSAGRIAVYLQLLAYGTLFVVMTIATISLSQSRRRSKELETAHEALRATNTRLSSEIEEREKIEDQLRQVQKMEALGQLTGGIAHDGALTQRLLAFARKQVLEPRPVDANKLVSGMSDLLHRTLGETIQTEIVLAGGLWRIHVDANQLETVRLNLVVNARDAMPEGGRLTIETANAHLDEGYVGRHMDVPLGQYVLLCVSDVGMRMPADVLEKAFDPFSPPKVRAAARGWGLAKFTASSGNRAATSKFIRNPGRERRSKSICRAISVTARSLRA